VLFTTFVVFAVKLVGGHEVITPASVNGADLVAVVVVDWLLRIRGRSSINPAEEPTERSDAAAAVTVFVLAYAAAIPFMNTSLIQGPVALAWHGADVAYFVNLLVAAAFYGGYRLLRMRRNAAS
jgi:NCS1 family nucleobase:cation symporter-1